MTPRDLTRLGTLLYGPCWRIPLAEALGVRRETIYRWANGKWPIPPGLTADLKRIMREKIAAVRKEIESL